jgi:hypothetical protein
VMCLLSIFWVFACYYGEGAVQALGFNRQPPCAATLHTILRRVDHEVVEAKLGTWAEGILAGRPPAENEEEPLAIDGKTLRGSRKQGAPGAHLLSVDGSCEARVLKPSSGPV